MHTVSLVHADDVSLLSDVPDFPCIGLLFNDDALLRMVTTQLADHVAHIPCVTLQHGDGTHDVDPAKRVLAANMFLITDWPFERLDVQFEIAAFLSVLLVGALAAPEEAEVSLIPIDDTMGSCIAAEMRSRLFPGSDAQKLQLAIQNEQQEKWLAQIGKELSVFYHNISNPLTILSGNIQLLQMLADSMHVSADLMKPITDIATVSARFEEDLQVIAVLKEKIKAGNLEKDT